MFDPIQDTQIHAKDARPQPHPLRFPRATTYPPQLTENDKDYTGVDETNVMKYNSGVGSSVVDAKGEGYYTLKGTDKTFVVEARTDFGGSGVNPYRADIYFNGMSTHNSARTRSQNSRPPVDNERETLCLLVMKLWDTGRASHDAGMSKMNGESALVSASNVLTQLFGIGDQLRKGSRYFDVRPVQGKGGEYLMGHYNWPNSPHLGANGQSLQEIIGQINAFTAINPELINLYLSHALDTDNGYVVLNDVQWDKVYDIFEGITHRCPPCNDARNTFLVTQ
ncbi:hypothetical protein Asppvi_005261 [Aspergillus pseudoviridinutans]|uniref:Uncharacterized protein n=1 Tax=Aspergillus pseudoviridinutans TaxID=1517512 RepID=A0A9P3BDK7_9EURO|nr:uncharacterized protein Asppvi_005261 [Aspergillus pseudoviridinutans]GIJ86373.1 hypothetical protein Asppvi_005261 [Aspergillus pseudoviridinutans]